MTKIIVFAGRKHSGKTTAADFLRKYYGYQRMSLVAPLRDMARELYGFTEEQVHGSAKDLTDPRTGLTPRTFLEDLESKARETFGENCWIDAFMNRVYLLGLSKIVVDDMRYPSEAEYFREVRANDGHFDITRVRIVNLDLPPHGPDDHPSETGPSEMVPKTHFDYQILHRPDNVEMFRDLDELMKDLGEAKKEIM